MNGKLHKYKLKATTRFRHLKSRYKTTTLAQYVYVKNKFILTTHSILSVKFPSISTSSSVLIISFSVTIILVLFYYILYINVKSSQDLANYGSFLSGLFSSLAFIWLISGFILQSHIYKAQFQSMNRNTVATEQQVFLALYKEALQFLFEEACQLVYIAHTDGFLKDLLVPVEPFSTQIADKFFAELEDHPDLEAEVIALASQYSGFVVADKMSNIVRLAKIVEARMGVIDDSLILTYSQTTFTRLLRISARLERTLALVDDQSRPNF